MARGTKRPDDDALWARIAGSVKPLRRREGAAPPAPADQAREDAKPQPKRTRTARPVPARSAAPRTPAEPPLSPGAAPGLDKRTAQRLKRGRLRIEARIDLHGMTQAEAHANLVRFITAQAAKGRRCVLVITGKGLRGGGAGIGVLRAELPRWLNEPGLRPLVLSFTPAQPRDGGGGAFYVYLRKAREP